MLALTAKDVSSGGCNDKTGYGLVQAKAAYDLLEQYGCEATGGANPSPLSNGIIGGCYANLPDHPSSKSIAAVTGSPTLAPTSRPPTRNPSKSPTKSPSSIPSTSHVPSLSASPSLSPQPTLSSMPSTTCSTDEKKLEINFILNEVPSGIVWFVLEKCSLDIVFQCSGCYKDSEPYSSESFVGCLPASADGTGEEAGYTFYFDDYSGSYYGARGGYTIDVDGETVFNSTGNIKLTEQVKLGNNETCPVPSTSPTQNPTRANCNAFQLEVFTDSQPLETMWVLERLSGNTVATVASGPPPGYFSPNTLYKDVANQCLTPGEYVFSMYDIAANGIEDPGYYSISLNGIELRRNSSFGVYENTRFVVKDTAMPSLAKGAGGSLFSDETLPINQSWRIIMTEDFENGFGRFRTGGLGVTHSDEAYLRHGVVQIEGGDYSSIYETVHIETRFTRYRATISFYAEEMDVDDSFCLDFSINDGMHWQEGSCWHSSVDFENGAWDDITAEFEATGVNSTLGIRFRCAADSNVDDKLYIDRIQLDGLE